MSAAMAHTNGDSKTLPIATPKRNTLALTEYSASPTASDEDAKTKAVKAGVPEDFLLPSGYPDVCIHLSAPTLSWFIC